MRCPRCGTWLRTGVARCGPCGAELADDSTRPTGSPDGVDDTPPWASGWTDPSPGRGRGQRRRVLVAVGAVGLVAIGASGATWLREEPSRSPVAAHEQRHAASSQAAASVGDFAAVYETVHDGVAQVLVETCGGDFTGTAFLVRPQLMVTAQHVVEDASEVRVDFDGRVLDVAIDGVDLRHDLAVLRLERRVDGHLFDFVADDAVPGTGWPRSAIRSTSPRR